MKHNNVEFSVKVNDVITPLSCSAMIIEFIKYIIYQKQIIPYPYERLKMYVDKGKTRIIDSAQKNIEGQSVCSENVQNSKHSLISEKYFKKTQDAYHSLENIFKLITDELTATNYDRIEEIVLLLGTSFINPQDVFRICIPSLSYSHLVKHHSTQKNWRNLFKTIINSDKFHDLVSNNSCTSNLHVMLKMKPEMSISSAFYIPRDSFKLPTKVFEDGVDKSNQSSLLTSSGNDHLCKMSEELTKTIDLNTSKTYCNWFQIKDTIRYFANVDIKGTSLTDIWMNPELLK